MLEGGQWSGNIRELQNCIEKAVILSEGEVITGKDIQIDTRSGPGVTSEASVMPGLTGHLSEEAQVREALERTGGNISAAAKLLGVSRPTLYAKLKKYGL